MRIRLTAMVGAAPPVALLAVLAALAIGATGPSRPSTTDGDLISSSAEGFVDHGVAAKVAELRGIVGLHTADGRDLVIANTSDLSDRGHVLITDLDSGETQQVYGPEGVRNSPPYAAVLASTGRFYTGQGPVLLELDPATAKWTFHGVPSADASAYLAFTEAPDGVIWAASVYRTVLISYDPSTGDMVDHGRMDPAEQYVFDLAVDDRGWVYGGIGTARGNIVAYYPVSGEKRSLVPEDERIHENAVVYPTQDGAAVGRAAGRTYRLHDGMATAIDPADAAARKDVGDIYWSQRTARFPSGRRVIHYNLPERWLDVLEPGASEPRRVDIDYVAGGVTITSFGLGPDGVAYGSTAHPMHFLAFDTRSLILSDYGHIPAIGGGNFCSITHQGGAVFGAQYSHGRLWAYDPGLPWQPEDGNPRWLSEWPQDVTRPRSAIAHPDGRHVLMSGYAGYGLCGGGIGIYDVVDGTETLLTAEDDLLPGHSPIALAALSSGDIVGGTSVDCPGGGHTTATEGEVFVLDWRTRQIARHMVPVAGERHVVSMAVAPDGLVHGLTGHATWFVFDAAAGVLVHSESLAAYGSVPRHSLHVDRDGSLMALFSRALVRLDSVALTHAVIATPPEPITAGGALSDGVLVFASGAHVWSYREPIAPAYLPRAHRGGSR